MGWPRRAERSGSRSSAGTSASTTRASGADIDPTPVVGMLGLIDRLVRRPPGVRLVDGGNVVVLGPEPRSLSGSRWAWEQRPPRSGAAIARLRGAHRGDGLVRDLVMDGQLLGRPRCVRWPRCGAGRDGGTQRCGRGVEPASIPSREWLFADSASTVVACVAPDQTDGVVDAAARDGVSAAILGTATGDRLRIGSSIDVALTDAIDAWRDRIPEALGAGTAH